MISTKQKEGNCIVTHGYTLSRASTIDALPIAFWSFGLCVGTFTVARRGLHNVLWLAKHGAECPPPGYPYVCTRCWSLLADVWALQLGLWLGPGLLWLCGGITLDYVASSVWASQTPGLLISLELIRVWMAPHMRGCLPNRQGHIWHVPSSFFLIEGAGREKLSPAGLSLKSNT